MQIKEEIVKEAKRHGISDKTLKELIREYMENKRREPENFADLVEGAVC